MKIPPQIMTSITNYSEPATQTKSFVLKHRGKNTGAIPQTHLETLWELKAQRTEEEVDGRRYRFVPDVISKTSNEELIAVDATRQSALTPQFGKRRFS